MTDLLSYSNRRIMEIGKSQQQKYQSQEHCDESVQTRGHPNVSPALMQRRAQRAQMEQRSSTAIFDSNRPPFAPNANFFVDVSLPFENADDLGIDSSIPSRPRPDEDILGLPFDVGKPTCSINLLCHRNGILQKHQIQVISKGRCSGLNQFENLIASNKRLIQTDAQLFKIVKKTYERKMYGIWRTFFSLKSLREIRLVSFTPFDYRPVPALVPDSVKQDILFAYRHPEKLLSNDEWIQWVFNLRQPSRRYALEFVESWSALRILIAVSTILVSSTALGVTWAAVKDDTQTAFTVASFFLGAGSLLLAALATVSSVEASTSAESGQIQQQNTNGYHAPASELVDMNPSYAPPLEASRESDRQMQLMLLEQQNKRQQMMTPQDQENTPTTRGIGKTKMGKHVHACGFPGCHKVFTRQEHLRRHELKHRDDMSIRCSDTTRQGSLTSALQSMIEAESGCDQGSSEF